MIKSLVGRNVEPLIRQMAVELAGAFYEQNRSPRFRRAFPTVDAYLSGLQIVGDGQVKKTPAGWLHHVILGRQLLVRMLGQSDAAVHPEMKERIYQALLRDRQQSVKVGQKIHQRMERDQDGKAERRLRTG